MYEQIIEKVSKYLKKEEISIFEKCYKESTKQYENKLFLDKINVLDYINNVLLHLTKYQVAIESLLSCLLLKIDNIDYSYIASVYGEDTKEMLEALVKIDNVKEKTNYAIDNENYRKIFVALAKDYNVLIIRLIMQQELMKYLDLFDEDFQTKVATETLDVYSPIAHRLGMYKIKTFLENTSIYYLEREKYLYIQDMLKQRSEERQNKIDNMIDKIKKLLGDHNIPYYSIKGRPKEILKIGRRTRRS
jgi:GTP pyrophosphokinase